MSQEDLGELRRRQWADPSGRRAGSDVLQLVIAQALERIAQAEAAAVVDTCTMLKAVVKLTPHAEILTLMEKGRLVPVTVPCLAEELDNQLGRVRIHEGEIPDSQRLVTREVMSKAVMIGTKRDRFRDVRDVIPLRVIDDRNDRAVVAAAWRARSFNVPLVTDDADLREAAAELLTIFGIAVMRTELFLDSLDQRKRE